MKICFVCNEYPPVPGGGIGIFVKNMAEAFASLGAEAWVIGHGRKVVRPVIQNGVKIHWISLPNILYRKIILGGYPYSIASLIRRHTLSWQLARLVRSQKMDAVETYDFSGPLAFRPECKLVVRLHGSVYVYRHGEGRPNIISPLDRHFEQKQVRMADHVIAVSRHIGEATNQVMQLNRPYQVIHNGVNTDHFSPMPSPTREKQILFAGNIMWRKGVFDLIRAMPLILQRHPDAILSIAGGASGEHLEQLNVELGALHPDIRARIRFPGKVTYEQMPALYHAASVFVFPSRVEACGLTCVEAMACGRPVVATSLASGPELIEDGISGLLADPRSPTDLALKICTILDDPRLAANLGKAARERALECFSLKKLGPENVAFYRSILS